MKFYYLPRRCTGASLRYTTPFLFLCFVFILPALLTCHCRSVSSFSNAKAGIPGSLCAARTAMSLSIERVQKSAENEYSSGNGHFSQSSRELSSNLFRISKFVTYWCSIYVRFVMWFAIDQFSYQWFKHDWNFTDITIIVVTNDYNARPIRQ